jgi:hypothetical protein
MEGRKRAAKRGDFGIPFYKNADSRKNVKWKWLVVLLTDVEVGGGTKEKTYNLLTFRLNAMERYPIWTKILLY